MYSDRVPFSLPNVYEGLATGNGIVTSTPSGLSLEFEIKDGFVGMLKSEIRNIEIPIGELHSIALKAGWFTTKVFIRTMSMATVSAIPGSETGQVELQIARKDKTAAAGLVSSLRLRLSERELARFET